MIEINLQGIVNSLVYSLIGIVILVVTFVTIDVTNKTYHLWTQIVEKHNIALAILMGSFSLSIAMIIAAAVHG